MILISLFILTLLAPTYLLAGSVTGNIQVVSPNTNWNGVMIQMTNGTIIDSACGNSSWAFIKVNTELDKTLVSVALTAKASKEIVTIYTSHCSTSPETPGAIPR